MASITIRKLDESVKAKLRIRAAEHGRSMEEEARVVLTEAVSSAEPESVAQSIRRHLAEAGLKGIELPAYSRTAMREPVDFSGPEYGAHEDQAAG
jgi:antitoxin FitA